jgi:hypothetical protein
MASAFYDTNGHSAEGSYDNPGHVWNQWWYTGDVQLPSIESRVVARHWPANFHSADDSALGASS